MTNKPDPTPHRPMSRADWDAMNEHARRVLHPEPDAKIAAIRKEVDEAYSEAVSIRFNIADMRVLLTALDAAQAELAQLRDRAALTDEEAATVEHVDNVLEDDADYFSSEGEQILVRDLLDIIARLTSHDPRSDGDA